MERLTEELSACSEEFARWWQAHHLATSAAADAPSTTPGRGLTFDYMKLAALDTPGVKLFVCMPGDERTRRSLPLLRGE
ncbi:hypothetical protein ACFVT2_26835 [Streptomyces sp. NPDC058000]|uniref:MmyB family transcriptional regulator n=1 Tax=Streptomyces sp. NPDC058000 TaxID=3346299 RepID=UPI0036EC6D5F